MSIGLTRSGKGRSYSYGLRSREGSRWVSLGSFNGRCKPAPALDCIAGAKRLLQNWTQQNQTTQSELEIVLASNSNWHRRVTKIGQMFLYPFLSKLLLQRRYQHKHFVDDTQFTSSFRSRVCRYGDDIHPEFEDTRRVTCDRTHTRVCFLVFLL